MTQSAEKTLEEIRDIFLGTSTLGTTVTVEQKTYHIVGHGELAGSVTAVKMPSLACKLVKFVPLNDNAGNVYIGSSANMTLPNGSTDTTTGLQLDAGQDSGWFPVANLDEFWRRCDNAGDDLTYIALG